MATTQPGPWTWRIACATMVAALMVLLAGPMIALGLLGWQAGLGMFVIAALLAGIGGIICLVALFRKRGSLGVVLAAAADIAALAVPAAIVANGRAFPPINDITTDTGNPPVFVAITADMRGPGTASLMYNPSYAAIQAKGYPKLSALLVPSAPAVAFDKALAAAKAKGWEIIASDVATGRIEATATVPWWGFKDDIVVRIAPEGDGSRIDVRSTSRVGKGDLGVNAQRITDYFDALKA